MKIFKVLGVILMISVLSTPLFSQSKNQTDAVLMTIGDSEYTLEEFDYYFLKNTEKPNPAEAKQAVEEYLGLFTNFKLKVKEAISLKMDEDPGFVEEYTGYKDQLMEPFLSSAKVNEDLILEAYQRLQEEIAGTHILIIPKGSKTPEDTLLAYNQALEYKKRIDNGEDMNELAKKNSEDRSAVNNSGYLGYFTAMQMVYPFENAAYNGKVGEVVGPFKTRFGYHILRIDDRRPARGQARAAHIMVRFAEDSTAQENAELKINSIYESIKNGKDWDELCKLYSDDKNTSSKGGELKWFGTGQLVAEFEDATFAMDSAGSISKPVKTRFGWHIIKLLEKKPPLSLDEQRADIEKRIAKDSQTAIKKKAALKLIKEKNNYAIDSVILDYALSAIDSTLIDGKWQIGPSAKKGKKTIFTLSDNKYKVIDFWDYVIENQKKRNSTSLSDYVGYLYNQFEETSIFNFEKDFIAKNNKEYKMISDEYKSGILLFNLMEEKVWNKAIQDTTGLKAYFEKNILNYPLERHLIVRKFVLSDSSLVDDLLSQLSLTNKQLDSLFNSKEALTLQSEDLTLYEGDNVFMDSHWKKGNHIEQSNDFTIVWSVTEINGKGNQQLDSIRGTVISDYQKSLELEWIQELKNKYPIKVMTPVINRYILSFE